AESIMIAPWPAPDHRRYDPQIEAQFARFQEVLRAVRDVRARHNVPPRRMIRFSVRCDRATAELLQPMAGYFGPLAQAEPTGWGPDVQPPALVAAAAAAGMEIFVDLAGLIDLDAEIARKKQELAKLQSLMESKQKKLADPAFVQKAPAAVVQQHRQSLQSLQEQYDALRRWLTQHGQGKP
ncbi:MAG TPA: valine--tRNA ligase, partial [Thermoguttaceae bacterium]|nr:valine--tRNA ligase [Thermoguttaceae bacterium]